MYPRAARIGFLPKDKAVIVLGESRYLTGRPIILLRKKWLGLIKSAEVSLTPKVNLAAGEGYEETSPEKNEYWGTYANAWFKNFNREKPLSGFIRIWDYIPKVITERMLSELHDVVLFGFEV